MSSVRHTHEDCYAHLADGALTVGNSLIERRWSIGPGLPAPESLTDKSTGTQWLAGTKAPAAAIPGLDLSGDPRISLQARADDDLGVAREHLLVTLSLDFPSASVKWEILIYPGAAMLRTRLSVKAGPDAVTEPEDSDDGAQRDYLDRLPINALHCGWRAVEFRDVTDSENNLVHERHGLFYERSASLLTANLCFIRNNLTHDGLLIVKEGPTSRGHLNYPGGDFYIKGTEALVVGTGLTADDLRSGEWVACYSCAVGVWHGAEPESLALLHDYYRCRKDNRANPRFSIMSNTWGDRSKDSRVSEAFIVREIAAAAKLGVSAVQIDDGWQTGGSHSAMMLGEDESTGASEFWRVHAERFPNGLAPIAEAARQHGVELGLWFVPAAWGGYANWARDAAILLDLHRAHGIRWFKLDGIQLTSRAAEGRLLRMVRKVRAESDGVVTFNLDLTAGVRLGFLGEVQYGNIFLENRYTDWRNYFPHYTLRNLWMLSRYYPSSDLQIEFLNVDRNTQLYSGDPLAPAECGIEYAFACSMFANPLAWMELTGLSADSMRTLGKIIHLYRQHQAAILSGHILPIGDEPDGATWTGFQSLGPDGSGYVLFLKERNPDPSHRYKLWHTPPAADLHIEPLAGHGVPALHDDGCCTVDIPGNFQYLLARITA